MAGAGGKKKFKFDFEIDLMGNKPSELKVDFQKEAREIVDGNKELQKIVKPLKFKVEAELDDREWDEKKIVEEGYYGFRMQIKGFDQCVKKFKSDSKVEAVKKGYDTLTKMADKGFEKWLKDTESGKGDNAKSLKEGGKAIKEMDKVDFKNASQVPRQKAMQALDPVSKSDGKDKKVAEKAKADLKAASDIFESAGGPAYDAIEAFLNMSEKVQKDNKADAKIKAFGAKIGKQKKTFSTMSDMLHDIRLTFTEAMKAADDEKLDKAAAKDFIEQFKSLKAADTAATGIEKMMKQYAKEFADIEKDLK